MPKVLVSTVVTHPETGAPVVLREGEDLPDWAEPLVGDHVIDEPKQPGDHVIDEPKQPAGARRKG